MMYYDASGNRYSGPSMGAGWMAALGYTTVAPEVSEPARPVTEWVNKESFINALYLLVPASALAAVLADPEQTKAAVAGLALLSTDAAPGGMINLRDERVAGFLALAGLTLDQVRAAMGLDAETAGGEA